MECDKEKEIVKGLQKDSECFSRAEEGAGASESGRTDESKMAQCTQERIEEVQQQLECSDSTNSIHQETVECVETVENSAVAGNDNMDDSEHVVVADNKENKVTCEGNQHEANATQSCYVKQLEENAQLGTAQLLSSEISVEQDMQEVPGQLENNNSVAYNANEALNATPEKVITESKSDSQLRTVDTKEPEFLEASNGKTLSENISSNTTESMETENIISTFPRSNEIKTKTDNTTPTATSLGLLAQYNSDSDAGDADCEDDDVVEVPVPASKDYRNKIVEIGSESDSESDSESSSSDDSDVEYLTKIRKEINKTIDLEDDEDDDDGDDATGSGKGKKKQSQMRVKGEMLLDELPPIQDLHITVPEEECVELGRVHSIIDQLLLVSVIQDSLLLDLDTVLFLDKGKKVLGEVFDVLGQVADPMYCVRFNSHKEIEEKGIKIGDTVYVAPKTQYTQFVILSSLMKLRGSDASWENDVEPPPRYLDYSDDEQEREARSRLRNKDRPNDHQDPVKRSRANDNDVAASSSSMPSSSWSTNTPNPQRSGRFNRERAAPVRSSYQYQRQHQMPPNAPHSGSWHSNYQQPYSSFHNAHMMPQQMPSAMPPPNAFYMPGAYAPPPMSPIPSPSPLPMYVLNPMAVVPPGMLNNRPQYRNPQQYQQMRRSTTHSPPPAPPGLD